MNVEYQETSVHKNLYGEEDDKAISLESVARVGDHIGYERKSGEETVDIYFVRANSSDVFSQGINGC